MRFIHLSDLHIGRRVNGFSMLEDQSYILRQILNVIDEEKPDAILVAGDVYDKSVPSAEAVLQFDWFLNAMNERKLQVFVISGNHDSPERIAFGNRLMWQSGIHMVPVYDGSAESFTMTDAYGPVHIHMLPFLKPAVVREFAQDEIVESYTDAYRAAIARMDIRPGERNVLVAHAFVTNAVGSGSEDISVGGADHVDGSVFDAFDYVALGHLHRPQKVGSERIRYCGTPLKYDLSEISQQKSITVVDMGKKGEIGIREVPLRPLREMRRLRGTYMELTARKNYEGTDVEDYLYITLMDEEDIPDALNRMRSIYPNIMRLDYDNARTRNAETLVFSNDAPSLNPLELFADFYAQQNGQPMSDAQRRFIAELIEQIWEEDE